ncbi:MAG: hypothetical protein VKS61_18200 [Candidatus Sericytochromatia bacterium]|nr:hypothetical protein [Candidatus Sericytochromatia bacterium]
MIFGFSGLGFLAPPIGIFSAACGMALAHGLVGREPGPDLAALSSGCGLLVGAWCVDRLGRWLNGPQQVLVDVATGDAVVLGPRHTFMGAGLEHSGFLFRLVAAGIWLYQAWHSARGWWWAGYLVLVAALACWLWLRGAEEAPPTQPDPPAEPAPGPTPEAPA